MEDKVRVNGMTFVPYLKADEIRNQVVRIAGELRKDLEGKSPVFICVLNGAFIFASDLFRELGMHDSVMTFMRYKSYEGTSSTGNVKQIIGLHEDIKGKDVVIIEDIVDTGLTAANMIEDIKQREPASIRFVTLLNKPKNSLNGFKPDYSAFEIPPKFIIGYGLDLDGKARDLKDIYVVENED